MFSRSAYSIFHDPYTGTHTITGSTICPQVKLNYSYSYSPNIDIRNNSHVDLDRLAELQKLVAKNPNRMDVKLELIKLQRANKSKFIGRPKRKKRK